MKAVYGQELVNSLRERCDKVNERLWIVVPYIGNPTSVKKIIGRVWMDNPNIDFRLITDLTDPFSLNSQTLKEFYKHGVIRHLPGVHAKIYITDNESLVTSANLTSTAFAKRHEVGMFLNERETDEILSLFRNWWKKSNIITEAQLEPLLNANTESSEEKSGTGLKSHWHLPHIPSKQTYWLKPIGVSDSPIKESRSFEKSPDYLHFSTPSRRPKVYKGDILITYGIGAKRILSVYKATSDIIKVTRKEIRRNKRVKRWPWYVTGTNLNPAFGKEWFKYSLFASDLVNDYLRKNTKGSITAAGGKNLNALMRGKDKIKLDPHFAEYVINRMSKLTGAKK